MDSLDSQYDLMAKMLDAAELRHRVIAQNVANVNTPGYHRKEVLFEDALARAVESGDGAKLQAVKPQIAEAHGDVGRVDGNTVDIDAEMGRLSKNNLLFRLFGQILNGQLSTMRTAITGK